jgi:phosphate starvation-inducible PhoH-like protein
MMEFSQMRKFMEMDIIEVIPLAFMRWSHPSTRHRHLRMRPRNTSTSQMLDVLTRLGRGSK